MSDYFIEAFNFIFLFSNDASFMCVFFLFSGFTSIATYFLTKELWSEGAGLFAACFIAIVPGYISRSVAGSYDNEGIAIFALQFTYYLWVIKIFILGLFCYYYLTNETNPYLILGQVRKHGIYFLGRFDIVVLLLHGNLFHYYYYHHF